ncbi:MAG: hypothetical protein V7K53_31310 [Nostoc sp.]|uniref:hypothetical protein n=1 Tax=Nostoc sp. TaxID=1180 RepID=UPI002FF547C2
MTINLQSLYPYGDLAARSVDHRRNFEWQKPLLGIVTSHYVMDYCESWQSSIIEEDKKKLVSLPSSLLILFNSLCSKSLILQVIGCLFLKIAKIPEQ